jgi:hypothetical protein
MAEEISRIPKIEMEITLPKILKEPLVLDNGIVLHEGDKVRHEECGDGTILRIWTYTDLGTLLYVDFGNGVKEEIHPHFVQKLSS